ncbi:MAG: alpha-(1-_3)-arabinofuranosyltransferase family protein [Actinomycetota bacterium]
MTRLLDWLSRHRLVLAVAALCYLPVVFSSSGDVGADTKTYLYLDPGGVLAEARHLWDSDVALGTVTHQNIGYLWPMGPFYWLFETLGSPDWFAQRIWLGSLLFAAAMGVRFLLRTFDWTGPGVGVAMVAYGLSPYLLDYSARISAVLLPWSGLPWMIGLTVLSVRHGGWRHPARFALVVLTVGSVNATSLLLVGLAPVFWLVHVTLVERTVPWRRSVAAAMRIGVASAVVSVWWVAGLVLQGRYSLPVTRYTETYEVVADAATAPEILRGLGYWFFYGNDKFGAWIEPSIEYTQGVWLLFLTFGLVVLALLANTVVRWRHRSFFVGLLVLGALIGVGSHPFDDPSFLGGLFKDFTRTDAGLALRSTPRAVPMVVLATAVLLGSVTGALQARFPRPGRAFTALTLVAIILANPAMWKVRMIEEHLHRDEHLPDYWLEAAEAFDADDDGSRIWELPGSDFASYRWGNTVDPITPGLIERGYVARELVPFGSAESADLLTAFDRRMQEVSLERESVIPIARLLSVGDLVHRADLTYERFRTPRPVPTAAFLESVPGLGAPVGFGEPVPNVAGPQQTLLDEVELSIDPTLPDPSPVTSYAVPDPLDVVRLRSGTAVTVVVGDGEGLVDAAAAGLLDVDRTIFFGADLVVDDRLRAEVTDTPAEIVITDANRRRSRRWGTLRENVGYTELAGQAALVFDPQDNRLPIFPSVDTTPGLDPDDTRTVAVHLDGPAITASRFGNPVTHTLDDRPVHAADGDLGTAWTVADFAEARGEFLRLDFGEPVTIDTIHAVQPQMEANRHITELTVVADGVERVLALTPTSWLPDGEVLTFEPVTASTFDVVITDLDYPVSDTYPVGISPVGFAELRLGEAVSTTEWLRTPRALVDRLADTIDDHSVSVVLTRERSNPQEPVRDTPETSMRRIVTLPTTRTFDVSGTVRLDPTVAPDLVDQFVGRTDGDLVVTSTGSLEGNLLTAPSAMLDGDTETSFVGRFDDQVGQAWRVRSAEPFDVGGIELDIVVGELHSVPTELGVAIDDVEIGRFPTGLRLDTPDGLTTVRLPVDATGVASVRIEVTASEDRLTRDWYSNAFISMPFAVAEMRVGGLSIAEPTVLDDTCRSGLVSVDGADVPVRLVGDLDAARRGEPLRLEGCATVEAGAGDVFVRSDDGGLPITIDQVVLESRVDTGATLTLPDLSVDRRSDVEMHVQVPAGDGPRWLVLGQSHNLGWTASLDGLDLGEPHLIDGFANGWRLPEAGGTVVLEWTPQRLVDRALLFSAIAIVVVLVLAMRPAGPAATRRSDAPPRLLDMATRGHRAPLGSALVAGGVVTLFALANLPELEPVAVLVGGAAVVAVRLTHGARLPAGLAAGLFAITSLLIMIEQVLERHPPDFIWPQQFDRFHVLGVVTILLLAADYVRSAVASDDRT